MHLGHILFNVSNVEFQYAKLHRNNGTVYAVMLMIVQLLLVMMVIVQLLLVRHRGPETNGYTHTHTHTHTTQLLTPYRAYH